MKIHVSRVLRFKLKGSDSLRATQPEILPSFIMDRSGNIFGCGPKLLAHNRFISVRTHAQAKKLPSPPPLTNSLLQNKLSTPFRHKLGDLTGNAGQRRKPYSSWMKNGSRARMSTSTAGMEQQQSQQQGEGSSCAAGDGKTLVVVGGGAAGVFGALRAKALAPHLTVVVVDKSQPLGKVRTLSLGKVRVLSLKYYSEPMRRDI